MTIQKIKIGLAGLMGMFLVTSCISDADKMHDDLSLTAFGDIVRHEGKANFDIVLDNYDTLKTFNTSTFNPEQTKTGTRIYFVADITDRNNKAPFETLKGNLRSIKLITVQQPLLLSEVKDEDNLGDNDLLLEQIMVSGKYLTTNYIIHQNDGSIKHTVSYVVDDVTPAEEGVLNIKMRHNENGDIPSIPYSYVTSCDILKYQKAAPNGKLKINVYYDMKFAKDEVKSCEWKAGDEWYLANK